MASVSDLDRQEIVQAALKKAFEKFARKGLIPQEKVENLTLELLEARAALLQVELQRLQAEHQRVTALHQSLSATRANRP
jgi:uncharacterized small protein (DUF1192 family)